MSAKDCGESGIFTDVGADVLVFARMIAIRAAASSLDRGPPLIGLLLSAVAIRAVYPE